MRPSSGVVTSEFGDRVHPITGAVSFHSGIDLGGGYGTPILASNCGVVISAGVNGGYGNDVCIKHSPTMTTCYSHLDEILVATGQTVKKGQIIGKEGSTGFSTGPHLHFMVLVNGSPQNPRNYVPI
jgi:murein DD-endopeptidase MepM/ murein hydrolase activator NlpD